MRVVEGLLFAPLKNNDIAIQHRDVPRVGLDRFDGSLETGKWNREGQVHVDIWEDGAEVGRLPVIWIAVEERDSQAAVGGPDEQWTEADR